MTGDRKGRPYVKGTSRAPSPTPIILNSCAVGAGALDSPHTYDSIYPTKEQYTCIALLHSSYSVIYTLVLNGTFAAIQLISDGCSLTQPCEIFTPTRPSYSPPP